MKGQDKEWCKQILQQVDRHQSSLLANLIERVFQDAFKSLFNKLTKDENMAVMAD